ncbi:MAG: hypothetical protein JNJ91_12890 [Flavobacteriales bacterium]|nr:hypothetical protein [Flavobacteriales bacterium]
MHPIHWFTLPVLGIIAWEDLRARSIHWWWPPLVGIALAAHLAVAQPDHDLVAGIGYNLLFLVLQFGGALLLLAVRRGDWSNPVDRSIGSGDLLFCAALTTGFAPPNFVAFLLSGLLLCILWYLARTALRPRSTPTIPLAGLLALHLIVWLVAAPHLPMDPFTGWFTAAQP